MKTSAIKLLGTSLFAALLASLCCIAPLLAIVVGGVTGAMSAFGWVEPLRSYLIAVTVAVLALAWYQRLKASRAAAACACEEDAEPIFFKSSTFLLAFSCLALLLLTFPAYAGAFYGQPGTQAASVQTDFRQIVKQQVKGMSCTGCEAHVNQQIGKLAGVFSVSTSYEKGSAVVKYDSTKIKPKQILQAAKKTGYTVAIEKK